MNRFLVAVCLFAFSVMAHADQKEAVPGFFEAYFEKLKLQFCTENEEPIEDIGKDQKRVQRWTRKSSYHDFKRLPNGFTVDYTAKVDMHNAVLKGEEVVRTEPETHYLSTLRFELGYDPLLDAYVGFARYTDFNKNGKPESKLGVAYAIRMKVEGQLQISAEEFTPRSNSALEKNLTQIKWRESFRWNDGVMFRDWSEEDYKIDLKTGARLEMINSSRSTDTSYDCQ